jgi:PadR family transcriptional regulator PadR
MPAAAPQSDLLQGTLDLLILKALALQELHGMGISRRITQITNETFDVKAALCFLRSIAWNRQVG